MFKKVFKKFVCFFLIVLNFVPMAKVSALPTFSNGLQVPLYKKIIEFFLPTQNKAQETLSSGKYVYVSGYPIGFSISGAGAVVVEKSAVVTTEGYKNPTDGVDIQIGDIIKEINGQAVTSGETITSVVNLPENINNYITLKITRKEQQHEVKIKAEYDVFASSYRLGIWVRDNAVGVGMMTYIQEDGSFGALGHPITDIDTGSILPVSGGRVYKCSIIGVQKGTRGTPGELKGLFLKSSNTVGEVNKNAKTGVYGEIDDEKISNFAGERLEVALPKEVEMGPATIISTIDGISPKHYTAEIVKSSYTTSSGDKCMVIRITDDALKSATGGIVQGMSGSPIVQNGKLIGCVTHVFVSDPEKGFASFITDMLAE